MNESKDHKGLSSTGIGIMPSMDTPIPTCSQTDTDPFAGHIRPGYKLCSFVDEFISTDAGDVPVIKTSLGKDDLFSTFYVRLGINRYRYSVSPGLYAVGKPNKTSEVRHLHTRGRRLDRGRRLVALLDLASGSLGRANFMVGILHRPEC